MKFEEALEKLKKDFSIENLHNTKDKADKIISAFGLEAGEEFLAENIILSKLEYHAQVKTMLYLIDVLLEVEK